jgi:ribonuclease BN (tRNA processing enzyme)
MTRGCPELGLTTAPRHDKEPPYDRAIIVVLGAGTPTPTPSRWGSAFAARVGGEHIMFDCGPAATWKLVKAGIVPTQVDYLFFTHHHFDHDVDYPCFLLTRWDQSIGRENLLRVAALIWRPTARWRRGSAIEPV